MVFNSYLLLFILYFQLLQIADGVREFDPGPVEAFEELFSLFARTATQFIAGKGFHVGLSVMSSGTNVSTKSLYSLSVSVFPWVMSV